MAKERAHDDGEMDGKMAEALSALPIFPLPGTVFFPHTLLPLHIFEPRYRQMTEHVLTGHLHMAIVLHDPARVDVDGPRGVARVAGLGRVVHHERLPDGRFHLLLQGVGRVRLERELPMEGLLYRRVVATLLPAFHDDEDHTQTEMSSLRACYAQLLEACPDARDALGDLPLCVTDPVVLADVLQAALIDDVGERQAALEQTSVRERLQHAQTALATLLLRSMRTDDGPPN